MLKRGRANEISDKTSFIVIFRNIIIFETKKNLNTLAKVKIIAGFVCLAVLTFVILYVSNITAEIRFLVYIYAGITISFLLFKKTDKAEITFTDAKNNTIVLSGAAVIVALFMYVDPIAKFRSNDSTAVTVIVHGIKGRQDNILANKGEVTMTLPDGEVKRKKIDEDSRAVFPNLRIGQKVSLGIAFSEPYKSSHPDSMYTISEKQLIYLEVFLAGSERIYGQVFFKEMPLDGVTVTASGIDKPSVTDSLGRFEILVPKDLRNDHYELSFLKSKFKLKQKTCFPQSKAPVNVVMEKL